jgi:hypothetical protein
MWRSKSKSRGFAGRFNAKTQRSEDLRPEHDDEEDKAMMTKMETMWIGILYGIQKWTRRKLARAYLRYARRVVERSVARQQAWLN